jgi:hypothetical protein
MTPETVENITGHGRNRMTEKTTDYTVKEACLLQRHYKNARLIKKY